MERPANKINKQLTGTTSASVIMLRANGIPDVWANEIPDVWANDIPDVVAMVTSDAPDPLTTAWEPVPVLDCVVLFMVGSGGETERFFGGRPICVIDGHY